MSLKISSVFQQRIYAAFASPQKRTFAFNLMILWAGEALNRLVTALAFIHLARVFTPAVYGQVELTLAVMMLLTVLIDQGLGPLGSREIARSRAVTGSWVSNVVSIQLVIFALVFSVILILVGILPLSSNLAYLLVGYTFTLLGYPFILNWVFQGWDDMKWVAIPQFVRQVIFAGLVLILVWKPDQVLRLPWIELLSVAAAVAANIVLYRRQGIPLSINLKGVFDRSLFVDSLPIAGSQMIWALRMYLPSVVLGILLGEGHVGFFAASHRIVMVLQGAITVYFINIFPLMSKVSYPSTQGLVELLNRSLRWLVWPCMALAAATALIAPAAVRIVFGTNYLQPETIQVLVILIWIIPILAWRGHTRNALIAINRQREEMVSAVAAVVLMIVLFFPLIGAFGVVGAALAMAVSELAGAILTWWRLKVHVPELSLIRALLFLS